MASLLIDEIRTPNLRNADELILLMNSFELLRVKIANERLQSLAKSVNSKLPKKEQYPEDESLLVNITNLLKKDVVSSLVRGMEKVSDYDKNPEYLLIILLGLKFDVIETFCQKVVIGNVSGGVEKIDTEKMYKKIANNLNPEFKKFLEPHLSTNEKIVYDCLDDYEKTKHFINKTSDSYLKMFVSKITDKTIEYMSSVSISNLMEITDILINGREK